MNDYTCPNCQRIRALPSTKPKVSGFCGCTSAPVDLVRVQWSKADWKLIDGPLAAILGVKPSAVARKRHALGKPKGTEGRKERAKDSYHRVADPSKIDPALSVNDNAERLGVSPARIRQLLREHAHAHAQA